MLSKNVLYQQLIVTNTLVFHNQHSHFLNEKPATNISSSFKYSIDDNIGLLMTSIVPPSCFSSSVISPYGIRTFKIPSSLIMS